MTGGADDALTDAIALYGTDEPPPDRRLLSCGPAQVTLEDGRLRHLHVGGREAIRGVAFLVRDRDWGTVAPRISDLRIDETLQGSRVTCRADYRIGGVLSAWIDLHLTATGLEASAVMRVTGEVWTNRAGFTMLHPIRDVAGSPVTVEHADGTRRQARFPDLIEPWQPFCDIAALTHQAGDWRIDCRFQGDVFEMEDQRQWGDASFKTYNRPLALPRPYRLAEGELPRQSVTIRWHRQPQRQARAQAAPGPGPTPGPTPGPGPGPAPDLPRFPQTALVMTGADARRAAGTPQELAAIAPQRLLCHLDASRGDIAPDLRAFADLQAVLPDLAMDLELIALCAPEGDPDAEFCAHARALAGSGLRAASVMVTPAVDRQSTPPGSPWPPCPPLDRIADAARRAFGGLRLGGGVASFFPELNRKPPPVGALDFVSHGLCPIVHAADDLSVLETLEAVPDILASGRAIAAGLEYQLGPSTIAMRQNPYGSRTIPNPDRRRICMAADDPRQDAAFGAAWTLGLATALAPAGLTVWTPAALYGPRGLVRDDGSMRPVAAVVAALAALSGQPVREAVQSGGLARLHLGDRLLQANLTAAPLPTAAHMLAAFAWRSDHAKTSSRPDGPPDA